MDKRTTPGHLFRENRTGFYVTFLGLMERGIWSPLFVALKKIIMTKEEAIQKSEEIWDKYSEYVDSDIDSLQSVAGKVILTRQQFDKGILELAVFIINNSK